MKHQTTYGSIACPEPVRYRVRAAGTLTIKKKAKEFAESYSEWNELCKQRVKATAWGVQKAFKS